MFADRSPRELAAIGLIEDAIARRVRREEIARHSTIAQRIIGRAPNSEPPPTSCGPKRRDVIGPRERRKRAVILRPSRRARMARHTA